MRTIQQQLDIIAGEQRMGFMTHVVIGHDSLEETKQRVRTMAANGVDIIELQIPFSDPLADGPAITAANQSAIANGITPSDCMQLAAELSQEVEIPLQFIGYYNTVLNYGVPQFVQDAVAAGVQGLTFPDLPFDADAQEQLFQVANAAGLPMIQLVSQLTTSDRLRKINRLATEATAGGFVYAVARFGVTGAGQELDSFIGEYLQRVRQCVTLPVALGFGISTPQHIAQLRDLGDNAPDIIVMGSALLAEPVATLPERLQQLCASL